MKRHSLRLVPFCFLSFLPSLRFVTYVTEWQSRSGYYVGDNATEVRIL